MRKVLTKLECLDGSYPGLATDARMLFDRGISSERVSAAISQKYHVALTKTASEKYRAKRWRPEREATQKQVEAGRAIWEMLGGSVGMDILLFAQLFELLGTLKDAKQIVAVKDHLLKCRSQELKETAFLLKSGQLRIPVDKKDEQEDAAAMEEKTKRVVRKIKAIFGITPDPEDEPTPPAVPAVVEEKRE